MKINVTPMILTDWKGRNFSADKQEKLLLQHIVFPAGMQIKTKRFCY